MLSCGIVYCAVKKVVLTFESTDKILECVRSNESYQAVFRGFAAYYAVQGSSSF